MAVSFDEAGAGLGSIVIEHVSRAGKSRRRREALARLTRRVWGVVSVLSPALRTSQKTGQSNGSRIWLPQSLDGADVLGSHGIVPPMADVLDVVLVRSALSLGMCSRLRIAGRKLISKKNLRGAEGMVVHFLGVVVYFAGMFVCFLGSCCVFVQELLCVEVSVEMRGWGVEGAWKGKEP